MRRQDSKFSNELHQLLITVSKHFYFDKDGYLKHQITPTDVTIQNCGKSRKEHLVYYVVRDHYSGTFVIRMGTTKRPIPFADFLYEAWGEEAVEEKFLHGIPDAIYVPKTIASDKLFAALRSLSIVPLHPPSGFASGIRIFRDIEEQLYFSMNERVNTTLEGVNKLRSDIYRYMISHGGLFDKWQANLHADKHPRQAPAKEQFCQRFAEVDSVPHAVEQTGRQLRERSKSKVAESGAASALPAFSLEKLYDAQELIYEAWELQGRQQRLAYARKALKISPYCADAYNLLADHSSSQEERYDLYKQGVRAGRLALGDRFFEENAGYFWGLIDTRPFMRALAGLAECQWRIGFRKEAISSCQELLQLNPNDNQGIRYVLINYLITEKREEEAGKLLSEYDEENSCFMEYSKALFAFKRGDDGKADKALEDAIKSNSHVTDYLLGKRYIPSQLSDSYTWGSREEAEIYADIARQAWEATPGALEWMAAATGK